MLVGVYLLVFLTGDKKASPKLGIDLQGGTRVTLTARTPDGSRPSRDALAQAQQIISARVNGLGVSGSEVVVDGDNLVITVPGSDGNEARNLGQTARLYIRPGDQLGARAEGSRRTQARSAAGRRRARSAGTGAGCARRPRTGRRTGPARSTRDTAATGRRRNRARPLRRRQGNRGPIRRTPRPARRRRRVPPRSQVRPPLRRPAARRHPARRRRRPGRRRPPMRPRPPDPRKDLAERIAEEKKWRQSARPVHPDDCPAVRGHPLRQRRHSGRQRRPEAAAGDLLDRP